MITKFIEVTNGERNWGKFMVARFDDEWNHLSSIQPPLTLLGATGWTPEHVVVLDLQTGEGAFFLPGGLAEADLKRHSIWVCPMFPYFLEWLYQQDLQVLSHLPDHVDLPNAPFALRGTRGGQPL